MEWLGIVAIIATVGIIGHKLEQKLNQIIRLLGARPE